jgi:hypothetical protein
LAAPIVQAFGHDSDHDGKFEQWDISVGLRLPKNTQLVAADFLSAFSYRTSEFVQVEMEGLAHFEF